MLTVQGKGVPYGIAIDHAATEVTLLLLPQPLSLLLPPFLSPC